MSYRNIKKLEREELDQEEQLLLKEYQGMLAEYYMDQKKIVGKEQEFRDSVN